MANVTRHCAIMPWPTWRYERAIRIAHPPCNPCIPQSNISVALCLHCTIITIVGLASGWRPKNHLACTEYVVH